MEVFALRIEYHPIAATLCLVFFLLVGCATEQSKLARLAKIAAEDKAWTARLAAVERLTDQALLMLRDRREAESSRPHENRWPWHS